MRLSYLYVYLLLSMPFYSSAQHIDIGILGGISRSNAFGTEQAKDYRDISQGWGGLYASFQFGKHFGIYTSLSYQTRGWKEEPIQPTTEKFLYKQSFGYLTQPVMAQYSWGEKVRGSVRLGTYLGYHFQQEIARVEGLRAWPGPFDRLIAPDYTPVFPDRIDWGAAAGAGIDIKLTEKFLLGVQTNFQVGLKNIGREIDWRGDNVPIKHIYGDLGVSLGYRVAGK